jgi:hypothetical protein
MEALEKSIKEEAAEEVEYQNQFSSKKRLKMTRILNIALRIKKLGEQYFILVLMRTEEEQENLNISL